jgi:hypothetical protein
MKLPAWAGDEFRRQAKHFSDLEKDFKNGYKEGELLKSTFSIR